MISRKKRTKNLVKIIVVLLILLVGVQLLIPTLSTDESKEFIVSLGIFGPIGVILYSIIAQVFAPLAGTPGSLVSLALFGIYQTMLYIYIAQLIGGTINFFLSKKFGRPIITYLVGKRFMKDLDQFVRVEGTGMLILARMFGFSIFDVISYATGLTKMKYKKYITITAIFSLFPLVLFTYLFRETDFNSTKGIFLWIGTLTVAAIIFLFFLRRAMHKKEKRIT